MQKCPVNYALVRPVICIDPRVMAGYPEKAQEKMKKCEDHHKPLQPGEIRITFHQRVLNLADTQKLLAVLDTAAKSVQPEITKVYKIFLEFKDVWAQDKEKQIQDFMEKNPFRDINELKRKLEYYKNLQKDIFQLPFSYTIAGIELRTTTYSHVLAVRGNPLDGGYILVPGVSIGWYPSHSAGLLKGIKRQWSTSGTLR
ncbi:hypothetical protein AVEN_218385-1 [Araneus ventricosus]|uniref:Uncharacterized protein n=1 Tax=Araneus ventricosus TaxID=182803 RepID=A0A4Y2NF34_ARAVE|nr:hypothetical protein AVEN_218385-1 [Araneus ventricosus]